MKKTLLAASICLLTFSGAIFASTATLAHAQSITPQQLVQLFISLGIIPADKVAAAEAAVANTGSPTSTTTVTNTGAGGILTVNLNSVPASRQNVFAGDRQDPLLGIKLQAQLSPITIQRVQLDLGNSTSFYTKYFTNLYLVSDTGQVLAQAALNSNTVTEQTVGSTNTYYLTFSGFNYTVPGDNSIHVLTVKGDVYGSIDSSLAGTSVSIGLDQNAIRGVDGAGVDQYGPTIVGTDVLENSVIINNQLLNSSATLQLLTDPSTPSTSTIAAAQGANSNEADGVTALVFDMAATNLTKVETVQIHTGSGFNSAYIPTAYLFLGSQQIASAPVINDGATFQSVNYYILANGKLPLTVKIDVKNVGASPVIAITSINSITAVDSNGNAVTISGSATGNQLTFINAAPIFTLVGTPTIVTGQTPIQNNQSTTTATANFLVNIQAIGGNFIFPTQSSGNTFNFGVNNGVIESPDTNSSTSWSIPSSGVVTNGLLSGQAFELQQNNSVQIPVSYTFNTNSLGAGIYAVTLAGINYINSSGVSQSTNLLANPIWTTRQISLTGTGSTQTNPTIAVFSPNGETSYVPGGAVQVNWSETGFSPKSIQIFLNSPIAGQLQQTLASLGASNQLVFNGILPQGLSSGSYTISVCDNGIPNPLASTKPLCGTSNSFIIIAPQTTSQTHITSITPNQIALVSGSTINIIGTNLVAAMTLQLSQNGQVIQLGLPSYISPDATQIQFILTPSNAQYIAPGIYQATLVNTSGSGTVRSNAINITLTSSQTTQSNPTISITGTPTLALTYDSSHTFNEVALTSTFNVTVTAGTSSLYLPSYAFPLSLMSSNNAQAQTNSQTSSFVVASKLNTTVTQYGTMSILPAGQTAQFTVTGYVNPKQLFAGTYHASLTDLDYFPSTVAGTINSNAPIPSNSTNAVTVIGETSPYITSISPTTISSGQTLTIQGQRLSGSTASIDGVFVTSAYNGSTVTIVIPSSLAVGNHTLQLNNSSTGASNSVVFTVSGSVQTNPTNPTVTLVGSPTLALSYNSSNKESGLTGSQLINITAGTSDTLVAYMGMDVKENTGVNAPHGFLPNGANARIITVLSNAQQQSATDSNGNPVTVYRVPAGQTGSFRVQLTANPSLMYAGHYSAHLSFVEVLNNGTYVSLPFTPIDSPYITVVGENASQTLTLSSSTPLTLSSSLPTTQSGTFVGPVQQTISIVQPNGNTAYQAGGTMNIAWTSSGLSSSINANLTSGSNTYSIFSGLATTTNSYSYTVPSNVVNGNYQVSLSSGSIRTTGNQFPVSSTVTSNPNSVPAPTTTSTPTQAAISIVSPSADQTYANGTSIPYSWTENITSPTIQVTLTNTDSNLIDNTAFFTGTVGVNNQSLNTSALNLPAGHYSLRVCYQVVPCDPSDATFTISGNPAGGNDGSSNNNSNPSPATVTLNPNQDYYFHITSGSITLADITNAGGMNPSPNGTPIDSLLLYAGTNVPAPTDSASTIYFPYNGTGGSGWLQLGDVSGFTPTTQQISTYFIIRKGANSTAGTFTVPSNVSYDGVTAQNGEPRPWNQQSVAKPSNLVASVINAVESFFGH